MLRSRLALFSLMVLWVLPASWAQSNNPVDGAAVAPASPSSALISVHELQVPEKARAACNKGTIRFAKKDPAGSIPEFQKAIKAFPGYYEAYARMGAANLALQRWGSAESAFRKSIELSSGGYAPANFGLGLILATVSNQFAEAESVIRAGLATNPADVTGHFVLAWVLYSTARLEEAEKTAREAVVAQPNFAGARLLLAQIHLRENKFSAVVQDLDSYLALGIPSSLDAQVRATRDQALRELPKIDPGSEVAQANR
jgi:tetratricopeptide (TPR) repeat protein